MCWQLANSYGLLPSGNPILAMSNFSNGHYIFTRDLLALESASPPLQNAPYNSIRVSPLRPHAWRRALQYFPDRPFADFLLRGITAGFRIGISSDRHLRPARRNLKSADDNPQVITAYLNREVELDRLVRLPACTESSSLPVQTSPFGAIPKKHRPNKWRLIVDLSSPQGHSVNEAIPTPLCSVSYSSVDQAVALACSLGRGCLLAKLDLKEAYRAVPVHPTDQRFLGVCWEGVTYIDRALPFGLRSAPKMFSAITDAMIWFLLERGVKSTLHHLDDFLLLGPPHSLVCQQALHTTLALCEELGFPVAPEKTEGPTTSLTFLGIKLDTQEQQIRLPREKQERLLATIALWMSKTECPTPRGAGKKRDLLSLIGLLNYTAVVIRPGRAFLHSLYEAAATVQHLDRWVHLNRTARADLSWWYTFLQVWNGKSIMPPKNPPFVIRSDASGSWGCGAIYENLWFQLRWPLSWQAVSIAPKELLPIVVAVVLWGPHWAGQRICCLCDNMAVVAAINKGAARDPVLAHLLRLLAFSTAVLDIHVAACHLPGVHNTSADALSRDRLQHFFYLNPQASPVPTIIPTELRELVFNRELSWTSPTWMGLWSASWTAALRLPPARPINRLNVVTQPSV